MRFCAFFTPNQRTPYGARNKAGVFPGDLRDAVLRAIELMVYELRRSEPQPCMRVSVIRHFVTCRDDVPRDRGKSSHVHAALEECGGNPEIFERTKEVRGGRRGAVVKRQGDLRAVLRPSPFRWAEYRRGSPAHCPCHPAKARRPQLLLRPAYRVVPRYVPNPLGESSEKDDHGPGIHGYRSITASSTSTPRPGSRGTIRSPGIDLQRLFEDLLRERERLHAGARRQSSSTGYSSHSTTVSGQQMPRCAAATTSSAVPQLWNANFRPARCDFRHQPPRDRIAALADHVHLHVIDGAGQDQIHVTQFVRLVLAARRAGRSSPPSAAIRLMIVRRHRLFEPGDLVLGELLRQMRSTVSQV